jgi:TRAP-type C4-dicarboxylate transport system substrate-binding protein
MKTKLALRTLGALSAASLLLSALATTVYAAPEELIFNVFIPKNAPLYKKGLRPWASEVEAASNGSLKISIPTSSLAPPKKQYDIVQDGVADISVAPLAFRKKKLSLDTIGGIPLIAPTATGASIAMWDTHEKFFADAGQWKEFVPLALFTLGSPSILSNKGAIKSKADLDGFKMLAVGKDKIKTWKNLGATPVGGAGQKPFEFLSSGVTDGATNPLGTAVVQGLLEASKHVTLIPGGFGGRAQFAIFIGRDRFEGLSKEAQEALTSTSGRLLSAKLGGIMDGHDAFGLKKFKEKGLAIHEASENLLKDINDASAFVEVNWLKAAKKHDVDGPAALAYFREVAAAQK